MQSQIGFNRAPEKGSGEGSGEGSGRLWCRAMARFNRILEKVLEKVWEALVQSQVRFNRVPEKVWEALVQSQVRFNRICGHLFHGNPAEVFPARFRKICTIKRRGCWGYHPSILVYPRVSPRSVGFASCGIEALGCSTNHSPIPDLEVSEREKCL